MASLTEKLKIIPLNADGIPNGLPFITLFNPETLQIQEQLSWTEQHAIGTQGDDPNFDSTKARTFSVEFTIDATGTAGPPIPVIAHILLFRQATSLLKGEDHRPSYLIVQWGTFISDCVLTSSDVTYNLFNAFGLPLRAKVRASFRERTKKGLSALTSMLSSPDLTHVKTVKEGDLLPLLVREVYKDQTRYLQVARVNKLKNFRRLQAGTPLIFPPIAAK